MLTFLVTCYILEGSDVYLECKVKSRPKTINIVWMKDVSKVFSKDK